MKKLHIVLVVILSLVFGALSPMAFAVEAGTVYEYKYEDILELLKGSALFLLQRARYLVKKLERRIFRVFTKLWEYQ